MRRCRRCGSGAPEAQLNQGRMLRTLASKTGADYHAQAKESRLRKREPGLDSATTDPSRAEPSLAVSVVSGRILLAPEAQRRGGT